MFIEPPIFERGMIGGNKVPCNHVKAGFLLNLRTELPLSQYGVTGCTSVSTIIKCLAKGVTDTPYNVCVGVYNLWLNRGMSKRASVKKWPQTVYSTQKVRIWVLILSGILRHLYCYSIGGGLLALVSHFRGPFFCTCPKTSYDPFFEWRWTCLAETPHATLVFNTQIPCNMKTCYDDESHKNVTEINTQTDIVNMLLISSDLPS